MGNISFREVDRRLPTGKSKRKKKIITYNVGLIFSYLYVLTHSQKMSLICHSTAFCLGKF